MLPVLGPLAQEMFVAVITDPAQRRRDDFIRHIFEDVRELKISVEALKESTNFQASFIEGVQIAIRTVDEQKLSWLKNAVINSAIMVDLAETIRHMFMQRIDALTSLHIKLLSVLDEPEKAPLDEGIVSGSLFMLVDAGVCELRGQQELTRAMVNDLMQISFVRDIMFGTTQSRQAMFAATINGSWARVSRVHCKALTEGRIASQLRSICTASSTL